MSQVVDKLWELQSVLSQLADKEKLLTVKPEDFSEIDRQYDTASTGIGRLNERVAALSVERRAIERELSENQELLKKYQGQLMQVKNQQQYAAAWKEIDVARKIVKEREDTLLANMVEIEETQKQLEAQRAPHEEVTRQHAAAYEAWQHSLGDLREEVARLREKVTRIEAGIPPGPLAEFHQIFKQRQGMAMARVVNQACSVCRVRVRPQTDQQLKRGETVMCESCRRILYLEKVAS